MLALSGCINCAALRQGMQSTGTELLQSSAKRRLQNPMLAACAHSRNRCQQLVQDAETTLDRKQASSCELQCLEVLQHLRLLKGPLGGP